MAETRGGTPSPTNEELAEHIGYRIESLLTDKYTNSLKIAVGIIRQELEKVQR